MRLWNEEGDFLEFPPMLHNKLSYIDSDLNNGTGIPTRFTLKLEDLDDLIEWAATQKELIKSEAP